MVYARYVSLKCKKRFISGSLRKFGNKLTAGTDLSTFVLYKMYGIALHYFITFYISASKITIVRIRKRHGKVCFFLNRLIPVVGKSTEHTARQNTALYAISKSM